MRQAGNGIAHEKRGISEQADGLTAEQHGGGSLPICEALARKAMRVDGARVSRGKVGEISSTIGQIGEAFILAMLSGGTPNLVAQKHGYQLSAIIGF